MELCVLGKLSINFPNMYSSTWPQYCGSIFCPFVLHHSSFYFAWLLFGHFSRHVFIEKHFAVNRVSMEMRNIYLLRDDGKFNVGPLSISDVTRGGVVPFCQLYSSDETKRQFVRHLVRSLCGLFRTSSTAPVFV